jgi:hypothetical protein
MATSSLSDIRMLRLRARPPSYASDQFHAALLLTLILGFRRLCDCFAYCFYCFARRHLCASAIGVQFAWPPDPLSDFGFQHTDVFKSRPLCSDALGHVLCNFNCRNNHSRCVAFGFYAARDLPASQISVGSCHRHGSNVLESTQAQFALRRVRYLFQFTPHSLIEYLPQPRRCEAPLGHRHRHLVIRASLSITISAAFRTCGVGHCSALLSYSLAHR